MSYKSTILSDYPLSYHPLDDLTTGVVPDFNDLLAQFNTYQDVLDYYSSYANMTGTTAYDYSGCNNHGIYSGAPETGILPVVVGNSMATKITNTEYVTFNIVNDYTAKYYGDSFGTKYSSDADFTLECWVYPKISSANEVPLFADATNNIGLFYDNGNITFKLDTKSLTYTIPYLNKVSHIVGVYGVNSASIYIDGKLMTTMSMSDFKFTNETCILKAGPTQNTDYFHINSFATYRYALNATQILKHYNAANGLYPIQIVVPENGELFQIKDNSPSMLFKYSYPGNKPWNSFTNADLGYNQTDNNLYMNPVSAGGAKTVTINDYISLPTALDIKASKIQWTATKGVSVYASTDGENYTECKNGGPIPDYYLNLVITGNQLFIRIVMDTNDASKYIPMISNLTLAFYDHQILYADNSSSYISNLEGSAFDISIGNKYSNILERDSNNGIKPSIFSGFYVNTINPIQTIEFFYTPEYINDDSGLVETEDGNGYLASVYRWNSSGLITKTGLSAIYVNGVNKISKTHIEDVLKPGELHHIIMVYTGAVSGAFKFNDSVYGSVPSLFQNIALYQTAFSQSKAQEIYELYIYGNYNIVNADNSASINMTENSVNYYNNDWIVVQTV